MNRIPRAYRSKEDELLFKKPTEDPTIQPDRVSPAVEGYFRIPAVWINEEPDPESVSVLNPEVHHAVVLRKKLNSGIEACVRRDGSFLFDFSSWNLAPQVLIPGYRVPFHENGYQAPQETSEAEAKAESYAVIRAQVMNVHQACLTTSERTVKNRGAAMGFPVTFWNTLKALTFEDALYYFDDTEDIRALARNSLNNKDQVLRERPFSRHILEKEIVEHSLELLDQILSLEDIVLVQWIETAYMAACRCAERRFGEAVVLAWAVCEQLLSSAWDGFQDDMKNSGRMSGKRREKLKGRDYTASVILEFLEASNRIDRDLYQLLESVRKSRNSWVHGMRTPEESNVSEAVRAVESLFWHVKKIRLLLGGGSRGGVPQWNVWIWDQIGGRCFLDSTGKHYDKVISQ
ncbi:MAG: hypothetical protein OXG10_02330 [Candidatus Dadabacteria bacterium]|nr:hypothetical protein [Candidatus Dadabacteria bacterium]